MKNTLDSAMLADANSAETLNNTILDYGDEYLQFKTKDEQGKENIIEVPKLAIAPLPLLRIKEAEFEMSATLQMNSQSESTPATPADRLAATRSRFMVVTDEGAAERSTSINVKMNVKLAQAEMPAGLTNLLQVVANNLQVRAIDEKE
ncbi:MAG: DUF2589 domain-containing protein [Bacteroidaceae bacterium]|nr:DUF2589 domain-containing protein [Bacteroidaceae bacterium]